MRIGKTVWLILTLIVLSIAAADNLALSAGDERSAPSIEEAKKEGKLVYYTAMSVADATVLVNKFKEKYPYIVSEMFRTGGERLLTRILTEARAGRYIPDVIQLSDFRAHAVKKEGLLMKYLSPESKSFREGFVDPDGFVTIYFNSNVMAYSTKLVPLQEAPRNYQDLLLPKWRGKLAMDMSDIKWFTGQLRIMGEEKGLDFMRRLAAQKLRRTSSTTLTINLLSAAEFPIAVNVYAHEVEAMKRKGAPLEWVGVQPIVATPQLIGVASHAQHPNAAKLFVDFALSKEGQEMIKGFNRISAREGVIPDPPRLTQGVKFYVLETKLADGMNRYHQWFREIFENK